jgi:hypothetical protein
MATITYDKAMELIRGIVKEEGSQLAAAKRLDISPQFLGDILAGKRDISDRVAGRLPPHGYRRVIFFERLYAADIGEGVKK